ncbi:dienelactone hydrolase family protein [Mycolicibacterium cosmeticum]|uniref:Hydrolase n=1 Tax=Mycolicibacterium cosmeticum TaxID=258533 RepID=W9AZ29_MYCCO|nr:dienelactone hydrolase family protein [Mycolicibacterium cosmeticum]TLH73910.1 dienelactone hydrolase family protein [Mycolicibacterium cosmeticum]CDO10808.1 hydrolase [Mycolicibacterium cosmeticum]
MPITHDTITTADGTAPVTVATPEGTGPWPGVVLYPDAGGLRPTMEQMAATLADFGYVVLVPDVYYRNPGWGPIDLNTVFGDQELRKQLFELMGTLTPEIIAADAEAFFDYLEARPDVTGTKFGTTGYCMGGRASLIVATRVPDRVAAALSFHGGRLAVADDPDSPHLLADKIQAVVYVGAAENDGSFTEDDGKRLADALSGAAVEHTIEFYPAAHGFAVPDHRAVYDEAAAQRHWEATERVFGAALAPA